MARYQAGITGKVGYETIRNDTAADSSDWLKNR